MMFRFTFSTVSENPVQDWPPNFICSIIRRILRAVCKEEIRVSVKRRIEAGIDNQRRNIVAPGELCLV